MIPALDLQIPLPKPTLVQYNLSRMTVREQIERLSALPPRKRLEEFRAISDPDVRRLVDEGLPPKLHAEMLAESGLESLNRNVREDVARRKGQKPDTAA